MTTSGIRLVTPLGPVRAGIRISWRIYGTVIREARRNAAREHGCRNPLARWMFRTVRRTHECHPERSEGSYAVPPILGLYPGERESTADSKREGCHCARKADQRMAATEEGRID